MRRAAALALAALLCLLLAGPASASAATARTTLPDLEDEVMCVECGTTLAVSSSPVAQQERAFIERRIEEGMTKRQIKAALVEEYGTDVLAQPPSKGFDMTAWLVPIVLAAGGLLGVAMAARRWRRRAAGDAVAGSDSGDGAGGDGNGELPALSEADNRRLDAELAAHDR